MTARLQPPPDQSFQTRPIYGWRPDTQWRCPSEYGRCRRIGCQRAPVADFKRAYRWWAYCDWHLYGRRIRDGVVEIPIFVEPQTSDDASE